ncbi:MAG: ACP S-malonyltransferase [Kiritimatiellae bacterium]|nr:ACP S-malonyltransferase [Kiritimatiellia bacterium]
MSSQAWLFPGQGAQAPGMGRDLAESSPEAAALFDRANEVLGMDLRRIIFEGPAEELTRSDRAQPAIFLVSAALADALRARRPALAWAAAAGHSLGEWTALYAAGVIGFDDALRVLRDRGRFMQEACTHNPGAMLAVIGLDSAGLDELFAKSGAEIANFNAPDQTVLSGTVEAIAEAERLAGEMGAKRAIRLQVAGAFHSTLMKPAAEQLRKALEGVAFHPPKFPVYSNVTGRPHGGPDDIRKAMVAQVTHSVRWVETVTAMRAAGVGRFVECGPGKVLSGLVKRIDRAAEMHTIGDLSSLQSAVDAL